MRLAELREEQLEKSEEAVKVHFEWVWPAVVDEEDDFDFSSLGCLIDLTGEEGGFSQGFKFKSTLTGVSEAGRLERFKDCGEGDFVLRSFFALWGRRSLSGGLPILF